MRALLLICLVACRFEHGAFVGGDADGDATGDGQNAGDSDGDSVKDEQDNCPLVANMGQRNHDGDSRGDVCDLCPGLPSVVDPDGDGDGVGDDCDPRPSDGGDTFVLFEGFYDPASISTWTGVGTWSVSGGRLVQSSETTDYAHLSPLAGPLASHAVMSSVRFDIVGVTNGSYDPGVAVGGGLAAGQGYYCTLRDDGGNQVGAYGFWVDGDNAITASDTTSWTGTFVTGTDVTLFGRIVGSENICTVSEGATPVRADDNHGPTEGGVELATTRMAASFDYVFVVAVGS
jgi:hypothetical protein